MDHKWIGAICIFLSCAGFGFQLCIAHKREERCLRQLVAALDFMQCELQYRLTPLPELCEQAGRNGKGIVGQVFLALSRKLEDSMLNDVASCMDAVLTQISDIPPTTKDHLRSLGTSLGRFDLQGQILGMEAVRQQCREALGSLKTDQDIRLRSYRTLGFCAGAALVILFI